MPTIMRVANLRFYFFSNEGPRAHIHVGLKSGSSEPSMKIWLDTLEVASLIGFSVKAERQILRYVSRYQKDLLDAWEEYFND